jgi:hypothetical protein
MIAPSTDVDAAATSSAIEPMNGPGDLTVINESQPQRRSILKFGGAFAVAPLITQLTGGIPAGQAVAAGTGAPAAVRWPTLSRKALKYSVPALDWQSGALPIGNGRLGAMLFADPYEERIQFNEQSLWGGVNNYDNALAGKPDSDFDTGMTGFGSYRNFGDVVVTFAPRARPKITAPGGPYNSSSSEGVDKSYDGESSTKWCIDGPGSKVQWQVELPEPVEVASYRLTSANDVPERDPQEWKFSGSADGTTWTTLDSRTLDAPFESRFQTKEFTCSDTHRHRHRRGLPLLPVRLRPQVGRQPLPVERDRPVRRRPRRGRLDLSVVTERALQGRRCPCGCPLPVQVAAAPSPVARTSPDRWTVIRPRSGGSTTPSRRSYGRPTCPARSPSPRTR